MNTILSFLLLKKNIIKRINLKNKNVWLFTAPEILHTNSPLNIITMISNKTGDKEEIDHASFVKFQIWNVAVTKHTWQQTLQSWSRGYYISMKKFPLCLWEIILILPILILPSDLLSPIFKNSICIFQP